jgi:hypothetical protein
VLPAGSHRLDYIPDGSRDYDADRYLAVIRGSSCVEGTAADIEPHLALDMCTKLRGEGIGIDV